MKSVAWFVAVIMMGGPVAALAGDAGILYGEHHAFSVSAPKGWVLDNQSGQSDGLQAVFYPTGGSWKESPVVMYANAYDLKDGTAVAQFIADDEQSFKSKHHKLKLQNYPSVQMNGGKTAKIKSFSYGTTHDLVAYVDEGQTVVTLVLTARGEKEWKNGETAFKELLQSYHFLTHQVNIEK